ncbi:MAG: BrnA antitoxin family protein, partial [Acidobacteria bacterium]|nr:BrnA antitoxin family protein [Acidobacteriota bacterium]
MPKRKSLKPIPQFESEDAEREFWATHDSTDYVDWSRARSATFSRLKPTTQTISLRLPEPLIANLKMLANKRDVPYQSLLKVFLSERIEEELRSFDAPRKPAARKSPVAPLAPPR